MTNKWKNKKESTASAASQDTAPKQKQSVAQITLTVVGVLLCIILLPMCIVNITLALKGAINPNEVPSIFGYSPMIVLSGSMESTIFTGDLILVKKVDPTTLKKEDIIAFKTGKGTEVVTHRIVEVTAVDGALAFRTKGDFVLNSVDTEPVTADRVVGLYTMRIPKFGKVAMFMQKPYGMAIMIGVPIVLYIAYYFVSKQVNAKREASQEAATATSVTEAAMDELASARAEIERLKQIRGDNTDESNQIATVQPQDSVSDCDNTESSKTTNKNNIKENENEKD